MAVEKKELVETVSLKSKTLQGEVLEAHFAPTKGMNLLSFKKGNIEAIDQSTWPLFEERYAGLGALIGPHFHHRDQIPYQPDEIQFPHIAALKKRGVKEPFSHGIGRYAPWKIESQTENTLEAVLSGKDVWKGVPLEKIEGQNFLMRYKASLDQKGLHIDFSITSEKGSMVGLHTYYALVNGEGTVRAQVENVYVDKEKTHPIPKEWDFRENVLKFDLKNPSDYRFFPYPDPLKNSITLDTPGHKIHVSYSSKTKDNAWQLWHPEGASFVCIEPLSSRTPRTPQLRSSQLSICIQIE